MSGSSFVRRKASRETINQTRPINYDKEKMTSATSSVPDQHGRFGPFGGRYVPETLMFALRQLTEYYEQGAPAAIRNFRSSSDYYLKQYVGRPCPALFRGNG